MDSKESKPPFDLKLDVGISDKKRRLPRRPELVDRIMALLRGNTSMSESDLEASERAFTQELQAFGSRMEALRKRNVYLERVFKEKKSQTTQQK